VFNLVGVLGAGVQIVVLTAAIALGAGWVPATVLAVEAAVLHNFVWHTQVTWRQRPAASIRAVLARLARFHLLNGLVSIGGNLLIMACLISVADWHPVLANGVAILVCGLVNFLASDRAVFTLAEAPVAVGTAARVEPARPRWRHLSTSRPLNPEP
jgi:putative flippase GtrA